MWERPFPNAGSAQSSGTLRIPCLFLSFSTSPEARRRHQAPNTDGAAAFRQDAAERNTTIDKLLRVDWLEIFDVEPILAEFLRTDALHSKLMWLCSAGETKPLGPSLAELYIPGQLFPRGWGCKYLFFLLFLLVDKGYSVKELHNVNERWGHSAWKGKPRHQTPTTGRNCCASRGAESSQE